MKLIYKTKIFSICVIAAGAMVGCSNEKSINTNIQPTPTVTESIPQSTGNIGTSASTSSSTQTSAPSNSSSQSSSPPISKSTPTKETPVYTRNQLQNDPKAPSKDPADYNSNGEFVPKNGISNNPADYNAKGEYKPVNQMTQEEKRKELENMLGKSLK